MIDSSAVSTSCRESPYIRGAVCLFVVMFTLLGYGAKARSVTYLSDVITVNLNTSYPDRKSVV